MIDSLGALEYLRIITDNGPWDLWVTITFRKKVPLHTAKKAFKHFLKNLNSPDEIYYDKVVFCYVCFETDSRFGVHLHVLIRGIHPRYAWKLEKKCYKQFGKSEVEPYYSRGGAEHYLAIRCNSSRSEDNCFMKINSRMRLRASA